MKVPVKPSLRAADLTEYNINTRPMQEGGVWRARQYLHEAARTVLTWRPSHGIVGRRLEALRCEDYSINGEGYKGGVPDLYRHFYDSRVSLS